MAENENLKCPSCGSTLKIGEEQVLELVAVADAAAPATAPTGAVQSDSAAAAAGSAAE